MKRPKWHAKALYLIFALALVVGLMPLTVLAGEATIVISGPPYAKEGETITVEAVTTPTADSVDWFIDGTPAGTDNTFPFELTTTFPGGSAGMHVISATGHWGATLTQDADFEILIGTGLIPQQEYNIIGTDATFCVPTAYNGHVVYWRFEPSPQLNGAWSIVSGGHPRGTEAPGAPGDNCVTVHGSGWGELVIYADTEAFTDASGSYPATSLMAIKKWGKIYDTWLFAWDEYTDEMIYPSGETQVWWDENYKKWIGNVTLYDLIIGLFITNGGEQFVSFADGADVEWWVMDARAPVHDLPSGIPAGDWMDPIFGPQKGLVTRINEMQAEWPSRLVGFDSCNIKYTETISGDTTIDDLAGLTSVNLVACGEEAVKVVVVAKYPDRLHYNEWAVFPEIISWNFWTQEPEKVPQVRWAGEKIVLEKQFGSSYAGFDVCFTLENESPGTLETIVPSNFRPPTGMQDTVWTTVDSDGVARCIVFSEKPGECDVACALYDDAAPYSLINQHGFVVFFLKLEELKLSNVQGERIYHDDGLWDPIVDVGVVSDATPSSIYDPTKNWEVNQFVGKTIQVWKGEYDDVNDFVKYIGDLQIREIVSNTADTVVVDPTWDTVPDPPIPTVQWYYEIISPVWDETLDDLSQELNVSQDALLRARVKGWFVGDDLSVRPEKLLDTDGDGIPDVRLPEGRWVLPDDWYILGGGLLWEELRPHYDIMDQPNDNIMSALDSNLDHAEELGPYFEWTLNAEPDQLDIQGALVAAAPVIGPYSTLDTYTPTIDHDYKLDRKTIVRNGKLNWWDCPMPPAKIIFEIDEGVGYFKDTDKGDVYYEWVNTVSEPQPVVPEGIVYTNPFYEVMIPASPFIPPFLNNCMYDWDSWNWTWPYGPYPFWDIINQPPGVVPTSDPDQHPTKVEVYSDNHGEAMVYLNGDWNLDLNDWATAAGYDIPTGTVVGNTTVKVMADYPYCRKHQPIVSNDVEKTWTWGKDIRGCEPATYPGGAVDPADIRMVFQVGNVIDCNNPVQTNYKIAFIWACDRDGFPTVGERIEWNLGTVDGTNMAVIPPIWTPPAISICLQDLEVDDGFLEGTFGHCTNPDRTKGESFMKEPGPEELALWEKFWPDEPCHHAVAAVMVYSDELTTRASLTAWLHEEEGIITRQWNINFGAIDDTDDPLILGDANQDNVVNTGDITKVKRIYFGMDVATMGADANKDDTVDAGDITKVKNIYFGT